MAKGPFMEYLRQRVAQTAANSFTEIEIATPTSKTENMAMLIHSIELYPSSYTDPAPADSDWVALTVANKHHTGNLQISDPECLAQFKALMTLGAVTNLIEYAGSQETKFEPPLLYPKAHLYLSIKSEGFAAALIGMFRIGYTLEKVSREDFISALVE
ncbi:hypothetical protein ES703_112784 [subsurface metagenome]